MKTSLLVAAAALAGAHAQTLSFFLASDTHLGFDPTGSVNTSYMKNVWAIDAMNALPNNVSWPSAAGGGLVKEPVGVIISGDLVDNGMYEWNQWLNWTALYGFDGTDGRLRFPVMEGRGNHDGGNSTDIQPHFVASEIIARNQLRKAAGAPFNVSGMSENGLHYAWEWYVSDTCKVHFVQLSLYAGHICKGCDPVSCFYGEACYGGFVYPEDSLGFIESYLNTTVGDSGQPVFFIQHYGFDGYSNSWYSQEERDELYATLRTVNFQGAIVGHTHAASIYGWNGTATSPQGQYDPTDATWLPVYNVPATQKGGTAGAEPSEFMIAEINMADAASNTVSFRLAHRQGAAWTDIMEVNKTFSCGKM